jgi:hypothetical protein
MRTMGMPLRRSDHLKVRENIGFAKSPGT